VLARLVLELGDHRKHVDKGILHMGASGRVIDSDRDPRTGE
jgi:hypothetical protein